MSTGGSTRWARALVTAAVLALTALGLPPASATEPPTPTLRFYAPVLTHSGVNGMNGALEVGTTPVAGADVVLQVGPTATGPWTTVAHTPTDPRGTYTFYVSVPGTGVYRTTFAGNATVGPATSRTIEVVVAPLPTRTSFYAPIAHAPGRTGMNGEVGGGWAKAGNAVRLQTSANATGPWTTVATTTAKSYGGYTFYVDVPVSAWYRATFPGTSTSAPSTSAAKHVTVIPGLLLFGQFSTGNSPMGSFTSTGTVRVSVSVTCGGTIFGGTNVKVFDTVWRLVPINVALVPNAHLTATGLIGPSGPHTILVQSYCPGQVTVRSQ